MVPQNDPAFSLVLVELKKEISELEAKEACLMIQTEEVRTSLKRAQSKYAGLINQTAPIASLPNEVLMSIFEYGQNSDPDPDEEMRFEMVVSQVTRRWRAVALHSPSLWATIEMSMIQPIESVAMYLHRSHNSPLDIRFDFYGDSSCDHVMESTILSFCDLVIPHVGRWQRLFIESDSVNTVTDITNAFRYLHASQLEHVSISIADDSGPNSMEGDDFSPQLFLLGEPTVSILRLGGAAVHGFWPPFANVRTLHLHEILDGTRVTFRRFRDMINACPLLVSLSIYKGVVDWPGQNPADIVMPHLETLRIHGPNRWYSELLLVLQAPKLDHLYLTSVKSSDIERFLEHPKIVAGLKKFPLLQSLTIRATNFLDHEYIALTRVFPSAINLDLHSAFLGTAARTPSTWDDVPLPNLYRLTLRGPFLEKEITTMVLWRKAIGHPVKILRVDPHVLEGKDELSLEAIRAMREDIIVEGVKGPNLSEWERIYEHDPF